jgi:hypothetical protein
MRKFTCISATSIIVLGSIVARAQNVDVGALYRQFQEAINRGDADAAIALLADDATWLRGTCQPNPCAGTPRLRQEIVRQIGDHNQASAFSTDAGGGAVVVRYELRSDFGRKKGVERRIQLDTVTAQDGKIRSIVTKLDMSDPETKTFAGAAAP